MKRKGILLLLLAILTTTGCGKREQTSALSTTENSAFCYEENENSTESDKQSSVENQSEVTSSLYIEPQKEEAMGEITIPTSFTEDEKWLHSFIKQNFEAANKYVQLEYMGCDGDIELCIEGVDQIGIYGRINSSGPFENAEKYRESLSEYYSADIVDRFMDNVTICKKVKETDESYYHADGINGRIYVEVVDGKKQDETGEPVNRLTKYIEVDGVMYKDTGMGSCGSAGVFEYSKIANMNDDEIIFTYPVKQDYTDEIILLGIAEGRLVQENGKWKFGWYLGEDNITEQYNSIWYD